MKKLIDIEYRPNMIDNMERWRGEDFHCCLEQYWESQGKGHSNAWTGPARDSLKIEARKAPTNMKSLEEFPLELIEVLEKAQQIYQRIKNR